MKRTIAAIAASAVLAGGAAAIRSATSPSACVMRVAGTHVDGCMRRTGGLTLPPKFGEPFPASEASGGECLPTECSR